MAEATLRDLYNAELDDLYAAERKIVDTLPTMVGAAHSQDLREALETHLERTRIHIERLELLFLQTGIGQHAQSTTAIDGIIRTAERHIRDTAVLQVRDAALIAAAHMSNTMRWRATVAPVRTRGSSATTTPPSCSSTHSMKREKPTKS